MKSLNKSLVKFSIAGISLVLTVFLTYYILTQPEEVKGSPGCVAISGGNCFDAGWTCDEFGDCTGAGCSWTGRPIYACLGTLDCTLYTEQGPCDTCSQCEWETVSTCDCASIQGGTAIDCSENCEIDTCDVGGIYVTFINSGR